MYNQVLAIFKKARRSSVTASSFRPGKTFRPECSTIICRSHGMLPFTPPFNAECPGLVPRRTGAPPTNGKAPRYATCGATRTRAGRGWSPVWSTNGQTMQRLLCDGIAKLYRRRSYPSDLPWPGNPHSLARDFFARLHPQSYARPVTVESPTHFGNRQRPAEVRPKPVSAPIKARI